MAHSEKLAHPLSLELALLYASMMHVYRGEPTPAVQRLETAEKLVAEQRLAFLLEPRLLRAGALITQGAARDAVACLQEGLAGRLGANTSRSFGLALLAQALARQSHAEAALSAVDDALRSTGETGERWWTAEIYRVRGLAYLAKDAVEESAACFQEALAIARQQQAKSLELRAATSLARLWGEQGRRAEARNLLAPVHGWFTEGFDTADLKDAAKLLSELA